MSSDEAEPPDVWALLSEPRMRPYVEAASGDRDRALALYEWSTRTAASAFEVVGHLEVLLRNALDRELARHAREADNGIPWFLLPTPGGDHVVDQVEAVRARLRPLRQENRHQIVANLTFGFWTGLLGARYEELWRSRIDRLDALLAEPAGHSGAPSTEEHQNDTSRNEGE